MVRKATYVENKLGFKCSLISRVADWEFVGLGFCPCPGPGLNPVPVHPLDSGLWTLDWWNGKS